MALFYQKKPNFDDYSHFFPVQNQVLDGGIHGHSDPKNCAKATKGAWQIWLMDD